MVNITGKIKNPILSESIIRSSVHRYQKKKCSTLSDIQQTAKMSLTNLSIFGRDEI